METPESFEELEARHVEVTQIIEGIVLEDEEHEATLKELLIEERRAREAYERIVREIKAKKEARSERTWEKARLEREKIALDTKMEQERVRRVKEESRDLNFKNMIQHARDKKFKWVENALDHQWEGALTLAHYGSALLNDTMGLGKTLTSIMYLDMVPCGEEQKFGAKKILALVPNDIVSEFTREVKRWAPHRNVLPLQGANVHMRQAAQMIAETSESFFFITNYESTWKDISWLSGIEWDVVMVDEAHNMKNTNGLTFERVQSLNKEHVLPITATFILNSPEDLFASLTLVAPNAFPEKQNFLYAYCIQNFEGKWTFREGGESALMRTLGGRIVKRDLEDANIKLPTQHFREIHIPIEDVPVEQREIIFQIKEHAQIMLESGESSQINAVIAQITRERQASCYPAGIEIKQTPSDYNFQTEMGMDPKPIGTVLFKVPDIMPSIKIDRAVERLVNVTGKGKRCVVFSMFKTALEELEKRLKDKGITVARYDGDTPQPVRNEIKKDFRRSDTSQTDYKYQVVLCNYMTGGVGLTLTAATYMLQLDEQWNPGKNEQAMKRIHRIGQTEETLVEVLRIEKTIDMWIKDVNSHKQAVIDGFNDEVNLLESFKAYVQEEIEPKKKSMSVSEVDDLLADLGI